MTVADTKIGMRVHYDTGWAHSSWSGTVRAVVDDVYVVVRKWRGARWRYELLNQYEWKHITAGPLPQRERKQTAW